MSRDLYNGYNVGENAWSPIMELEVGEEPTTCPLCGAPCLLKRIQQGGALRIEECSHCKQGYEVRDVTEEEEIVEQETEVSKLIRELETFTPQPGAAYDDFGSF